LVLSRAIYAVALTRQAVKRADRTSGAPNRVVKSKEAAGEIQKTARLGPHVQPAAQFFYPLVVVPSNG
jgi:hypothetical protein